MILPTRILKCASVFVLRKTFCVAADSFSLKQFLNHIHDRDRGVLVNFVVHFAFRVQPAHTFFTVAGDEGPFDGTGQLSGSPGAERFF